MDIREDNGYTRSHSSKINKVFIGHAKKKKTIDQTYYCFRYFGIQPLCGRRGAQMVVFLVLLPTVDAWNHHILNHITQGQQLGQSDFYIRYDFRLALLLHNSKCLEFSIMRLNAPTAIMCTEFTKIIKNVSSTFYKLSYETPNLSFFILVDSKSKSALKTI